MSTFVRTVWLAGRTLTIAVLLGQSADLTAEVKPPVGASPTSWISIVGQPPFVMPADQKAVALPLLVSLDATVDAKELTVELLSVRYEKLVDERIASLFSVEPSLERGAGRGLAILVKVAAVTSLRPGEYQLTIGAKRAKGSAAQQLAVVVERPGVQLAPLGKVSLDVLYEFPIFGSPTPSVYPKQLRFMQTPESKFSQITDVTTFVGPFKSAQGTSNGGTLEASPATPVAAGQPLLVTVTPNGFPAGVSTGSLEIRGSDIKAPQSVELEIRARYSTVWVIVLILSGLGIGYLLRVALQRRVELARARSGSVGVVEELENRLFRTPDQAFTDRIKAVLKEVREALDGRDPKAIDEKAKAANAALEEATKDLQTRINATHERLKTLRVIVNRPEDLPPDLSDVLRKASDACSRYAEYLAALDESRTARGLDATEPELVGNARAVLARWRTSLPVRINELDKLHFALDKSAADALVAATATLRGSIESAGLPGDLAQIAAALARVREVDAVTAAHLEWLSAAMERDLKEFELLFTACYGATDVTLADLATHISQLRSQLWAAGQRVDPARSIYEADTRRAAVAAFEKLLDVLVTKHTSTLQQSQRDAFESARKQQHYFDAVRALPGSVSRLKRGGQPSGGPETAAPMIRSPTAPAAEAISPELPPNLATESVATLKARTFGELAKAEVAQTAIAAVLITGLGYVLFADKFVGTLSDIATIFLWGFTLDISVSKLLDVAGPFAAKARPS